MSLWNPSLILLITRFPQAIVGQLYLNPSGPIHTQYAVQCLREICETNFRTSQQELNNSVLLITVLTSFNMTSPAYQIQQNLLKELNVISSWAFEVIQDERIEFRSRSECVEEGIGCKNRFVQNAKSDFYLIIVDNLENFYKKLAILPLMTNYNPQALFLVYYATRLQRYESEVHVILHQLWHKFNTNSLVVIPQSLQVLKVYTLEFTFATSASCLADPQVVPVANCVNGAFKDTISELYARKLRKNFNNCTVKIVAHSIEPFVIDEVDGFEILLMKQVGEVLRIHFDVMVSDEDSWGEKVDNEWTSDLGLVFRDWYLGIGNVYAQPAYVDDFAFTASHFQANLAWIVPIAQYVPKWRILTIIFSWELWSVCLALIVASALFLFLMAFRNDREFAYYKSFNNDFFLSLQIIITAAVFKHPVSDWTRLVFVAVAIFSIIISSVYTSSLINYLTNQYREPQIDSLEDILARDLTIGGLAMFQDVFNVTDDEKSMKIYDLYRVNDTVDYWLGRVGVQRDTCTIYNDYYVNYLISQMSDKVSRKGVSLVHIIKPQLFSYSLTILMKKGFPLFDDINNVIGYMIRAGFVNHLDHKFSDAVKKIEASEQEETVVQQLSTDHLQGAFAILILGYLGGTGSFLLEIIIRLTKRQIRKRNRK